MSAFNPDRCNQAVFDHGEIVSIEAWSKQQANDYCQKETANSDYWYDWNSAAGRVVLRRLKKDALNTRATSNEGSSDE